MTSAATLRVCYASNQSFGDTPDDYVDLGVTFTHLVPPTIAPLRTVTGAAQVLSVTGGTSGDQIAWTKAGGCGGVVGPATLTELYILSWIQR